MAISIDGRVKDQPTDRALAMVNWLADVEALMARAAWRDARQSLERDLDAVGESAELTALYGEVLLRLGLPRDALRWLEPRLQRIAQSANRRAFVKVVNLSGAASFELGSIDDAALFFDLARDRALAVGDHLTVARALNNLALVASTRGQWRTAMQYYMLAIPSYERVGDLRGIAECHHNVAATLIESGDLDQAEEWHRRAIGLAIEIGNARLRAFVIAGRAEVRLRKRDHDMALVLARQAAQAFRELSDPSSEAHALGVAGQAELGQASVEGEHAIARALDTLAHAVSLAEQSGVTRVLAECLLASARALVAANRANDARTDLRRARSAFESLGTTAKVYIVDSLLADLEIITPNDNT
jgi:tetratricopeptide (TPR) repeat protein